MRKEERILIVLLCLLTSLSALAQDKGSLIRRALRDGNRYYQQGNYDKAEAEYLKAYEVDSTNIQVLYNLGTTYLMKRDVGAANGKLAKAAVHPASENRMKGARVFHNLGVNLQMAQDYDKAIEAYKQSLRLNPTDEETRYNLALCQKLRKDQPQQDQQKQDQQKDQQQDQNKDEQQQQQPQPQQEQTPPPPPQDEMSKENAMQLLEAVKQDEKQVKERMNQHPKNASRRKKSKDW